MKTLFALVLTIFLTPKDNDQSIREYLWKKRPLLIFADSNQSPAYQKQIALLEKEAAALKDRDVVVLTCVGSFPKLAEKYRITNEKITVILIGKDGGEKWRTTNPFAVQDLLNRIDAMPMGAQEARTRAGQ